MISLCRLLIRVLDAVMARTTAACKAVARLGGEPDWTPAAETRAQVCIITFKVDYCLSMRSFVSLRWSAVVASCALIASSRNADRRRQHRPPAVARTLLQLVFDTVRTRAAGLGTLLTRTPTSIFNTMPACG